MVAAGVDPMTIAAELGHTNGHLIFKTYGHLYPGAGRQAATALDRLVRGESVAYAWTRSEGS